MIRTHIGSILELRSAATRGRIKHLTFLVASQVKSVGIFLKKTVHNIVFVHQNVKYFRPVHFSVLTQSRAIAQNLFQICEFRKLKKTVCPGVIRIRSSFTKRERNDSSTFRKANRLRAKLLKSCNQLYHRICLKSQCRSFVFGCLLQCAAAFVKLRQAEIL